MGRRRDRIIDIAVFCAWAAMVGTIAYAFSKGLYR